MLCRTPRVCADRWCGQHKASYALPIWRRFQRGGVHSDTETVSAVTGAFQAWQRSTVQVAPFISAAVVRNHADELARTSVTGQVLLGGGALALLIVSLLGMVVFRSLLRPIVDLARAATALGRGADVEIRNSNRQDEIGDLARALETWRRSMKHFLAISEATVALSESHDTGELLSASASTLMDMASARYVTIAVVRDGELLVAASAPGPIDAEWAGSPATPHGPALLAARTKKPVIGDLIDSDWYELWLQLPAIADCGPLMALPFISEGEVVGAAVWFRPAGDPAFTNADVENCQVVITQIAGAIRVGNIFEELVRTKAALDVANANNSDSKTEIPEARKVVELLTIEAGQLNVTASDLEAGVLGDPRRGDDHGVIVLPAGAAP